MALQVYKAPLIVLIFYIQSTHPVVEAVAQAQDLPMLSALVVKAAAVVAVDPTLSPDPAVLQQHKPIHLCFWKPLLVLVVALIESLPTVHPVVVVALLLLVPLAQLAQVARVAQADLFGDSPTLAVAVAVDQSQRLQVLVVLVSAQQAAALALATTHSPTRAAVAAVQAQQVLPIKAAMAATDSSLSGMLAFPSHRAVSSPTQADTPTTTSTQRTSTTF